MAVGRDSTTSGWPRTPPRWSKSAVTSAIDRASSREYAVYQVDGQNDGGFCGRHP